MSPVGPVPICMILFRCFVCFLWKIAESDRSGLSEAKSEARGGMLLAQGRS